MKYCKKCIQPDTRPGIKFDDEGICNPCRYYETLSAVDWEERRSQIEEIAQWAREKSTSEYDCIVSVSGGKDSHRLALFARNELGLMPLLVSTVAPPQHQTKIGTENLANLVSLGFDMITVAPAPEVWRKLMRKSFFDYANYCKSTELALYASAPRVAIAYEIPLIFLGENNTLVYGETGGGKDGGDASNMRNYNTLAGGDIDWMIHDDIDMDELIPYEYPSAEDMQAAEIRVVYLGYYIKDFNNFVNGKIAIENGLKYRTVPLTDTGCLYPHGAVDDDFVVLNQLAKYLKFGFGKATDEICEMIRTNRMSREHGIMLAKKLDGEFHPRYLRMFCEYLEITEDDFWKVLASNRNRDIWENNEDENWQLKFSYWDTN
jgi:N-acetyl sugar amidotransferase